MPGMTVFLCCGIMSYFMKKSRGSLELDNFYWKIIAVTAFMGILNKILVKSKINS